MYEDVPERLTQAVAQLADEYSTNTIYVSAAGLVAANYLNLNLADAAGPTFLDRKSPLGGSSLTWTERLRRSGPAAGESG